MYFFIKAGLTMVFYSMDIICMVSQGTSVTTSV